MKLWILDWTLAARATALVLSLSMPGCGSGATDRDSSSSAVTGAQSKPLVTLQGLDNFRDLGCDDAAREKGRCDPRVTKDGHRVRSGRLYRSEQLSRLSDEARFLGLGVNQIVDFRGTVEKAAAPDPALAQVRVTSLPIFDEEHPDREVGAQLNAHLSAFSTALDSGDAGVIDDARTDLDNWVATLFDQMRAAYLSFVDNADVMGQFGAFVRNVAEGNVTTFHCQSGKDRTGFAASIVLRGLGMPWSEVLRDYLRSNTALAEQNKATIAAIGKVWTEAAGHKGPESLQTIIGVDERYLTAAYARMQEVYGDGHPPPAGEIVSDEAVAAFYDRAFGSGVQAKLRATLLE